VTKMKRQQTLVFIALLSLLISACVSQGGVNKSEDTAAEAHVSLGLGYLQQRRPQLAIQSFTRAIELDSRLASAHHYAAESYRQMRQYARADKHFVKALKLAPKDAAIKNNYGVYLCDRQRYDEADGYFIEAIEDKFYTSTAEALENAGLCARKSGDSVLAAKRFRQAIEHDERRARSLYQLADLSYLANEILAARGFVQRYFAVANANASSLWLAIRIEHALNNDDDVREYATSLHKNFPNSDEAKEFKHFWANQ